MLESYVKYFTLIVCSFYIYTKLLNARNTLKYIIGSLIFALLFSIFIYYIWVFFQPMTIPVLILFSFLYITLAAKTEPGLSITTTIISFGISFIFFLISSVLASFIFNLIGISYSDTNRRIIYICVSLLQFLFSTIPFRIRRLKSGMPFLRKKGGGSIGITISTILLCCFIVISNANEPKSIFFITPIIFAFLCCTLIFIWWKNRLKKEYMTKLKADEIQGLRDALQKKEDQIKQLQQHNDFLAKIIHKDNKLIPAMELAVRAYIQYFERENEADIRLKGQMLLEQLRSISCERSGILSEYQSANEKLPLTGVFQIDALMSYMLNKAIGNGIHYEFIVSGSVKFMIENIINESDLRTLLADLVENAIIAVKSCDKKEILVSAGISEEHYIIEIYDSGIPFEPETIISFGRQKSTTHADTGGSGIGLTTVSEILGKYNASFAIEEFSEEYKIFTKKVSVKFDNLNQYIVKAKTNEVIRAISTRKDIVLKD